MRLCLFSGRFYGRCHANTFNSKIASLLTYSTLADLAIKQNKTLLSRKSLGNYYWLKWKTLWKKSEWSGRENPRKIITKMMNYRLQISLPLTNDALPLMAVNFFSFHFIGQNWTMRKNNLELSSRNLRVSITTHSLFGHNLGNQQRSVIRFWSVSETLFLTSILRFFFSFISVITIIFISQFDGCQILINEQRKLVCVWCIKVEGVSFPHHVWHHSELNSGNSVMLKKWKTYIVPSTNIWTQFYKSIN